MKVFSPWLRAGNRYKKPDDWAQSIRPEAGSADQKPQARGELGSTIAKAQNWLLKEQNAEDGYWSGILKADTTIESDTVMLLYFLGKGGSPMIRRLANQLLNEQLPDGGWPIYRNGPSEISATVKAYWALKFAGHSPEEPSLARARRKIKDLGGIHKVNTYTKFYMALFGLYEWKGVPTIPPELMLFPNWFYFNLYEMSAWTRSIVVPLSITWAHKPSVPCPPHAVLDELFPDSRRHVPLRETLPPCAFFSWTNFFLVGDRFLKSFLRRNRGPMRRSALRKAEDWMLEHLQDSDGLGAIYPGIVNTIISMKALGYADSDPRLVAQIAVLMDLEIKGETSEFQPCHSPLWDTAISVIALGDSGLDRAHPAMVNATRWILSKELKVAGDWKMTNPDGPVGGWPFQFNNAFYADVDDTAMVMLALRHVSLPGELSHEREKSCLRSLHWILSMQASNGGWAAFDKENTKTILEKIPFADHNAMIDPPYADITARVMEILGYIGYDTTYPCVARALDFLKKEQETDGSWYGRWGVNYIYGTWQALRGLAAIDEDMGQPYVRKAVDWLRSVQLPDGGWGETCVTYEDPSQKGKGPATPSQTAWALMGLMAAGVMDESVTRGFQYLITTQKEDGTWDEDEYTGTGFPKVFYLEYTLYRHYFPLQALGIYARARTQESGQAQKIPGRLGAR